MKLKRHPALVPTYSTLDGRYWIIRHGYNWPKIVWVIRDGGRNGEKIGSERSLREARAALERHGNR